ncbi:MAG TPA: SPOR domain-containing protein [Steroidobacteraceae bacterium]|nr:SPOR domain-containing protein [Steroidobacteraceae bacterium]
MERLVKERLVGAAVLLAAAVILIPEMLSGPKHERASTAAALPDDAPTKTYTIDLSQPAQAPAVSSAPEQAETTAAPPPESADMRSLTPIEASPESTVQQSEPHQETSPPSRPAPEVQAQASRRAAVPMAPKPAAEPSESPAKPAPVASDRAVPTSRGWAVQLGSFSKRETAEHLAQQVSSKGHKAFVMPVKSGNATLYRVRVGPLQDRAAADALQRQLKGDNSGATVVPHP